MRIIETVERLNIDHKIEEPYYSMLVKNNKGHIAITCVFAPLITFSICGLIALCILNLIFTNDLINIFMYVLLALFVIILGLWLLLEYKNSLKRIDIYKKMREDSLNKNNQKSLR